VWLEILLSIRSAPKKMKRKIRARSGGNPHTRNVVIQYSSFSFAGFFVVMRSRQIGIMVEAGTAAGLAAVVAPLALRLPRNRRKSALEKRAVYDITFMVFAFYDPVTGANITLSQIGNDRRRLCALRSVHK
jgi:hypothetical protein